MQSALRSACVREWLLARAALRRRDHAAAHHHLQRLHRLGSHFTSWHLRAHLGLLHVALEARRPGAALVQALLVGFALLTPVLAPLRADMDDPRQLPVDLQADVVGQRFRRWPIPTLLRRSVEAARSWFTDAVGRA